MYQCPYLFCKCNVKVTNIGYKFTRNKKNMFGIVSLA